MPSGAGQAKAEEERLRKWDESLMLRYSTVADIEAAKERALRDLQIRMSILKGNRRSLKQEVENYQAQAADTERSWQERGCGATGRLKTAGRNRGHRAPIGDRAQEIEDVSTAYQPDIERFKMLQEVVELRQTCWPTRNKEEQKSPRR